MENKEIKQNTVINHQNGVCTLAQIQEDVDFVKTRFAPDDSVFTYQTVQALIDKIVELQSVIIIFAAPK